MVKRMFVLNYEYLDEDELKLFNLITYISRQIMFLPGR